MSSGELLPVPQDHRHGGCRDDLADAGQVKDGGRLNGKAPRVKGEAAGSSCRENRTPVEDAEGSAGEGLVLNCFLKDPERGREARAGLGGRREGRHTSSIPAGHTGSHTGSLEVPLAGRLAVSGWTEHNRGCKQSGDQGANKLGDQTSTEQ